MTRLANVSGAEFLPDLPQLVAEVGLPGVIIICLIYALVNQNRALRSSEAGRLQDRDAFMDSIRSDSEKAAESRAKLTEAMHRQSTSFDKLTDRMEKLIDRQ